MDLLLLLSSLVLFFGSTVFAAKDKKKDAKVSVITSETNSGWGGSDSRVDSHDNYKGTYYNDAPGYQYQPSTGAPYSGYSGYYPGYNYVYGYNYSNNSDAAYNDYYNNYYNNYYKNPSNYSYNYYNATAGYNYYNNGYNQPATGGYAQPATSGYAQPATSGYAQPATSGYAQQATSGYAQPASSSYNSGYNNGYNSGYPQQVNGDYNQPATGGYYSGYTQQASSGYGNGYNQPVTNGYNQQGSSGYNQQVPSSYTQQVSNGYKIQASAPSTYNYLTNGGYNSNSNNNNNKYNYNKNQDYPVFAQNLGHSPTSADEQLIKEVIKSNGYEIKSSTGGSGSHPNDADGPVFVGGVFDLDTFPFKNLLNLDINGMPGLGAGQGVANVGLDMNQILRRKAQASRSNKKKPKPRKTATRKRPKVSFKPTSAEPPPPLDAHEIYADFIIENGGDPQPLEEEQETDQGQGQEGEEDEQREGDGDADADGEGQGQPNFNPGQPPQDQQDAASADQVYNFNIPTDVLGSGDLFDNTGSPQLLKRLSFGNMAKGLVRRAIKSMVYRIFPSVRNFKSVAQRGCRDVQHLGLNDSILMPLGLAVTLHPLLMPLVPFLLLTLGTIKAIESATCFVSVFF